MAEANVPKGFTRFLTPAFRILMGLLFLLTGLNGFLNFLPQPKALPPPGALAFVTAMKATGYMMQLVAGTQALTGLLLLVNRFVPLALALIAPVIVNIICFHLFLAPMAIGPAVFVLVAEAYLAWAYRNAFRGMLAARNHG